MPGQAPKLLAVEADEVLRNEAADSPVVERATMPIFVLSVMRRFTPH